MSNLRILRQNYLKVDDELVDLYHEMDANNDGRRDTALHAKYLEKYMQREDVKSGMRLFLIKELCKGVSDD